MSAPLASEFRDALAARYRIEEECGEGTSSVVYRARDLANDRDVAIKVMRRELSAASPAHRFLREVRIAATLRHPNIAELLDSGEAAGHLYCVFPFIKGETIRHRIAREGPLPVSETIRLTKQIGEALTHAHERGVIHRDVKPENVLLSNGNAVLTDFGIARAIVVAAGDRVTDSGIAVGTPSYMSPEQAAASRQVDPRTDQYALAICVYEMLAGDPPFMGHTPQAVIARHLADPPPRLEVVRPTVSPGIIAAIERALAKFPGDRYESVAAFVAALEAEDEKLVRQRRYSIASLTSAAVLVVAVLWIVLGQDPPLDPTRVVIFPARTAAQASDPEAGLRIADAIQVAVEHTDPLRWIPAWEHLDEATRRDPSLLGGSAMTALTRARGARYYVTSSTDSVPGRLSVTLQLTDALGDSVVAQQSGVDTTGTVPASALAIRALPTLLRSMLDTAARVDLSPLTDRRLPAIVRLLEGEEAYRTANFATAFERYQQAVAEDSQFAYAALKGAQAASWQTRLGEAIGLIEVARAHENLLPPKYRAFLRGIAAYQEGRADSAVAGFQAALGADPSWAEAAMALGDVYYHLLPSSSPLDSLAEASFRRAVTIDSSFTPPLFHLAEIEIRRGDRRRSLAYIDRLRHVGADAVWTRHLAIMSRCIDGGLSAAEWRTVARASAEDALLAATALGGGARQPACAIEGFRAVLVTPQVSLGTAWDAVIGLHGQLLATGRSAEAVRLLDSARTAISTSAMGYSMIGVYADSAFRPAAEAASEWGTTTFGPAYERARPRTSWVFGVWEAWRKNRTVVDAIAARLAAQARETPSDLLTLASQSIAAHAALARGDTSGAIAGFGKIPAIAPRDSLSWEFLEPLAPDRLTYARLLLGRGRAEEALAVASVFDHPAPASFFAFVRPSLELRVRAAERLGRYALASEFRGRLRALGVAGQR